MMYVTFMVKGHLIVVLHIGLVLLPCQPFSYIFLQLKAFFVHV